MKPTSLRGKIASVALTDTGKVREHNEDMIGSEADIGLFVLADGMGGYNAGEVASGIAVKDRKSTRLNSSHQHRSRMPSSA